MDQRQRAERQRELQKNLLGVLVTLTPGNLLDFTVHWPSTGGWGSTAVPASDIYRPSPRLRDEIGVLESEQKECDETPYDEDDPWGSVEWESMLRVRRMDLAEELAGEVRLTLLLGRLMAHASQRRTERLIAALQSGVRAILSAPSPAGPSGKPSGEEARSQIIADLESGDEDSIFSAEFRAKLPLEIGEELRAELEAMQSRWDELQARRAAYDEADTVREHAAVERYHGELDEAEYYFDLNATCLRSRLLEQMRALLA